MPPPDLYCAYARHSDRHQETSVDQQIAEFRKFAAAQGLSLYEPVFEDRAKSGTTDAGRSGIKALMEFLERRPRPVKGVLLWASSRMARNVDDADFYKSSIRRAGYKILYLGDALLNVEGPMRGVFESLYQFKDAQYSLDLARDVKRGLVKTARDGNVISRVAKGYRLLQDGKKNKLEPDPDIAPLVVDAWERRAAGHTIIDIHEALHLFPRQGNYSQMFRRKIYLGILEWGGEEFPDFCPPLITRELWDRVQAVNWRKPEHPRRARSRFLLSGRAFCGKCKTKLGTKSAISHGRNYAYYYCRVDEGGCGEVSVRAEKLEQIVIEKLGETFTPEVIAPLYAKAQRDRAAHGDEFSRQEKSLRSRLASVERAIANLTKAIEGGAVFQSVAQQLTARESERAEIQKKINAMPPAPEVKRKVSLPALCREVKRILAGDDDADRRVLVRSAVARVDVFPARKPRLTVNPIVL